jgi:hypothetical protein
MPTDSAPRRATLLAAILALGALVPAPQGGLVTAASPGSFSTAMPPGYHVTTGTMPADPAHPGTPWAWEPGMSADPRGWIWAAGNHCFLLDNHLFNSEGLCHDPSSERPLPTFAPLWVSRDGGRGYTFVADPLRAIRAGELTSPGGEDTDVAVQPAARPGRTPLLYVVSSWGLSATLAISGDDGATWRLAQATGAPFTAGGMDRPWLAAAGACDLFLQYHPLVGSQNLAAAPRVDHLDGCALFDSAAAGEVAAVPLSSSSIESPAQQANGLQVMGKIAATAGRVQVAYVICDNFPETNLNCDSPGDHQSLHLATSADAGASWQDRVLPDAGLHGPLDDGVWPMSLAADAPTAAGVATVAIAVTDTHHVHLWTSPDGGQTWRLHPGALDAPLGWTRATVPSVAVRGRRVSVAWYGSAPEAGSAPQQWRLVVARSEDGGATFTLTSLDPVLAITPHDTPLADLLYDDFGALVAPDGATLLTYTQSCADKPPTDRECPGPPAGTAGSGFEVVRHARLEPFDANAPAAPAALPPSPAAELPNTSR